MQGQTSSISKRVRHSIQQVLPGTTHSFLTGTLLIGALAAFLASCCCCWACCCMAASLGRPQHLGQAVSFCNRCMRRSRCRVQSILSCTGTPCRLSHQLDSWHSSGQLLGLRGKPEGRSRNGKRDSGQATFQRCAALRGAGFLLENLQSVTHRCIIRPTLTGPAGRQFSGAC